MKFATVMQIGPLQRMDGWNFEFFKNKDVGGRHLKNHKNRDISATVWLIFTNFGTLEQNGSLNRTGREIVDCHKSKMADGRHFENR